MLTRLISACAVAAAALTLAGCGIFSTGPGGAWPAWIYTAGAVYPAENTSHTQYQLTANDFDFKGTVVAEGHSRNILGVFTEGDTGYASLLEEARSIGCDDVINVRLDVRYKNILFFYTEVDTILSGQGVKWK